LAVAGGGGCRPADGWWRCPRLTVGFGLAAAVALISPISWVDGVDEFRQLPTENPSPGQKVDVFGCDQLASVESLEFVLELVR
jgi:hypothetical protein